MQQLQFLYPVSGSSIFSLPTVGSYNYEFPTASGTIALTSNLSSYVPYTGATGDVFLGTNSITGAIGTFTQGVINGNGSNPGNLYLKKGVAPFFTNANNYGLIAAVSSSFILISDVDGANYKYASFNLSSLTNNTQRAYTLPDTSGTLALGTGTTNYVSKWTGTNTIGNSLIFDNGTNVGIGNTNTSYTLDVSGTGRFTGALSGTSATFSGIVTATGLFGFTLLGRASDNFGAIGFYSNSGATRYGYIQSGSTNGGQVVLNGDGGGSVTLDNIGIIFGTGSSFTERMRITSGGNVLIGTTINTGRLRMKQSADSFSNTFIIENFGNTSTFAFLIGSDDNLYLGYNGTAKGVTNYSTGVYTALSDINKKKDFEQSQIGLNAILGLKPTLYRMKTDDTEGNKELGFIAQEVKEFIPQAYVEGRDFIGLNYNAITATLVKAIQELSAQNQELNERLNKAGL
jgi:hypothetical protein